MEQIDPLRAQQVWNRVRGTEQAPDSLLRLLTLEQEAGQIYAQIARTPALSGSKVLSRLREESAAFVRIYQGMIALTSPGKPPAPPRSSLRGNPEGFLRHCWELRQKTLALLESGKFPPQFTATAELMQEKTMEHSLLILELLGHLRAHE